MDNCRTLIIAGKQLYSRAIILLLLCMFFPAARISGQDKALVNKSDFFPFSVWYSGGKARATMLSEVTPASREE